MKPFEEPSWFDWLDENGELRSDAPLMARLEYEKWQEKQELMWNEEE
jgi:hypothetical protein